MNLEADLSPADETAALSTLYHFEPEQSMPELLIYTDWDNKHMLLIKPLSLLHKHNYYIQTQILAYLWIHYPLNIDKNEIWALTFKKFVCPFDIVWCDSKSGLPVPSICTLYFPSYVRITNVLYMPGVFLSLSPLNRSLLETHILFITVHSAPKKVHDI